MNLSRLGLLVGAASLVACDDKEEELDDVVEINSAPVADAGQDQALTTDDPVNLDGGASFDPDGDLITYEWYFDSTPAESALGARYSFQGSGTTNGQTTFRPDATGTYLIGLRVTDTSGEVSNPDFVIVTVEEGNLPVADAGADLSGNEGDNFTLDGSGSWDPLGRDLTYTWAFESVPSTSALTALSATDTSAAFTADVGGRYVVSLIVDNGLSSSVPNTAIVEVASNNPLAPYADAGVDIEGEDCTAHAVSGAASFDPNGDTLQYRWSIQDRPTASTATNASFDDRNAAETTFYPDVAGEYTLALSVYDGTEWSSPDLLLITATERSFNTPPTVVAGTGGEYDGGEAECTEAGYSYRCDECDSVSTTIGVDASVTDADGDPVSLEWTAVSGAVNFTDATALSTRVVLSEADATEPSVCDLNEYQLRLTATDCTGASVTSDVVYTVSCCGVAPAAR